MDRTNWKWGKANINILMVSAVCGTVAIPLIWKFLPKKGASNTDEWIEIVEKFIGIFGLNVIQELLGDREFVSAKWFKWLQEKQLPFTIRLKKSLSVTSAKENKTHARTLFINLRQGQVRYIKMQKTLFGISLWLAATRAEDGEWVIVATNHQPEFALARYKLRWNIETLFGFLKSKGFCFEDTHITLPERLHNLLSVLAIAFCLAYKAGQIVAKEIPIKKKRHGRLEKSILRVGLDLLREIFFKMARSVNNFVDEIAPIFLKNGVVNLIFPRS